jgi:tetratricopeptide (TPR) repeat protein
MEIFDNTLNEYNRKVIYHVLEEFTSIDLPQVLPEISDIKNFVNVIAAANPKIQDIQSSAFGMDPIHRLNDPTLKSALFSLGTTLFHLTIKGDIPDDNIKSAKTLLEWAIKIDPSYFQAYNRLGDCWMRLMGGFETAVSCYKEALQYAQQKEATADAASNTQFDNFKGDNYFKIGICFIKLKRKGDAELFITVAKNIVSTDYQGLAEIGLKSWDQVFELLSRM